MKYTKLEKQLNNEFKKNSAKLSKCKNLPYYKDNEKALKKLFNNELQSIKNAENCNITINCVEVATIWKKSKVWGYNPHTTVDIYGKTSDNRNYHERFTGSASGCGYDKESAATAKAFNKSIVIKKMLFDYKEKRIKKVLHYSDTENHSIFGYGAGYGVLPYFEGGVGFNCHERILCRLGFETVARYENKETDYYKFLKK